MRLRGVFFNLLLFLIIQSCSSTRDTLYFLIGLLVRKGMFVKEWDSSFQYRFSLECIDQAYPTLSCPLGASWLAWRDIVISIDISKNHVK